MSKWYNEKGNNNDIVLASKIRLARNLRSIPFPCKMTNEMRKSVCKKIYASVQNSNLAGEFDLIELDKISFFRLLACNIRRYVNKIIFPVTHKSKLPFRKTVFIIAHFNAVGKYNFLYDNLCTEQKAYRSRNARPLPKIYPLKALDKSA